MFLEGLIMSSFDPAGYQHYLTMPQKAILRAVGAAFAALTLSACVTTSMQGYADREIPAQPIRRIVVYVAAQGPLAAALQTGAREEARKHYVIAVDALALLPPTRTYADPEIRKTLDATGIDAVLLVNVGDTGVTKEYAGTIFQGTYSGNTITNGTAATSSGTMNGSATPTYRYSRQTKFDARLIEVKSGRKLWIGNGQVDASGSLFMGNGTSADSAMVAIFNELQSKGLIGGVS
jgi:hypothetical protein